MAIMTQTSILTEDSVSRILRTSEQFSAWEKKDTKRATDTFRLLHNKVTVATVHAAMNKWRVHGVSNPIDDITEVAKLWAVGMPSTKEVVVTTPFQFGAMCSNDINPNLLAEVRAKSKFARFLDTTESVLRGFMYEPFSFKPLKTGSKILRIDEDAGTVTPVTTNITPVDASVSYPMYTSGSWRSSIGDLFHRDPSVWARKVSESCGVPLAEAIAAINATKR